MTDYVPTLVGFAVGILVGATSTGGGAVLTPALIMIARVPPSIAIGSDALIASGMKLVGGGFYAMRREVHWSTVGRLSAGSIPGAIVGLAILNRMPVERLDSWLTHTLGIVLVVAGAALLLRLIPGTGRSVRRTPNAAITMGLGFAIGMLVSMTSIGSGSLLLCALVLWYPLEAREIVGTDLVHALILSTVATLGHAAAGRVDLVLAGAVLVGAIPGVLVGARVVTGVRERPLRVMLAFMLVAIGAVFAVFGS